MLSVTINRAGLSLADLVLDNDPATGLWIPEDGAAVPGKRWTRTYAGSTFTHGAVQTRATLEHSEVELVVYAQGATQVALRTKQAELEAALFQWVFDLALTEDGQTTTYTADCGDVSWGAFDSGMTRVHMARAVVTVPVYPVGS